MGRVVLLRRGGDGGLLVKLHALQEVDAGVDMLVHDLVDIDEVDYLAIVGNEILDEGAALEGAAELESLCCVEEFDGQYSFGVLGDAVGLGRGVASHADEVFLVLTAGYAVDAAGGAQLFGLAGDGGCGVLRDHETAVEAGLCDEEAWKASFCIDELVGTAFAYAAQFGEGDGEEVEHHGERFSMEMASGDDEVFIGEDDGVVGSGVDFGFDDRSYVSDGVFCSAVDLRGTTEAVGVLYMFFVASNQLAAFGIFANSGGSLQLAFVGANHVERFKEGLDASVEGVEAKAEDHVGLRAEAFSFDQAPYGIGTHELGAVEEGEAFLALQRDGLPAFFGIHLFDIATAAFVVDVSDAENGGEHQVGERAEIAAGTEAALLVNDGEYVVVEAIDKTLCGDELDAAIAEREVLHLEQQHEFHDFLRDFVAYAAGMAHHQVFLQLAEFFLADGYAAKRAEAGGHAVDRLFLCFHFFIEVVAAFVDAGDGVVAQGDGHLIVDNLLNAVKGKFFGGDIMCHD